MFQENTANAFEVGRTRKIIGKAKGAFGAFRNTGVYKRFAAEGWSPFLEAYAKGATSLFGFSEAAEAKTLPVLGKLRFARGNTIAGLKGLGYGIGSGIAIGFVTGHSMYGVLGGAAIGGIASKLGLGSSIMPMFGAMSFMEGYNENGLAGGTKNLMISAAQWGLWDAGSKALAVATRGTAIGAVGSTVMGALRLIMNPAVATIAALGYTAYKGADYIAGLGRGAGVTEFAGSMGAFQTKPAYTMRQRALQEIARSHTNSRMVLGQEASLMHLR